VSRRRPRSVTEMGGGRLTYFRSWLSMVRLLSV
jgi:hypothetical protein